MLLCDWGFGVSRLEGRRRLPAGVKISGALHAFALLRFCAFPFLWRLRSPKKTSTFSKKARGVVYGAEQQGAVLAFTTILVLRCAVVLGGGTGGRAGRRGACSLNARLAQLLGRVVKVDRLIT